MSKIFERIVIKNKKMIDAKKISVRFSPLTEIQHAAHFAIYVRPGELFVYKSRTGETGLVNDYFDVMKQMNLAYAEESICEPFNDVVQRELYDEMNKVLKRHHLL